jgi:mannan endo-1,4-beta-mannosidase
MPSTRKRNTLFTLFAIILLATHLPAQTDAFVQRTGTKLTLNGTAFRYSGPNIEWLGPGRLRSPRPHGPHRWLPPLHRAH